MPSIRRVACIALFFFVFPLLAAEQPWSGAPFTGDPRAIIAAAEAVPAGEADAVVLLDELQYTFDDQGHATSSWRKVFRIVDESAIDDWSTIGTEWVPWYRERPDIAARVIAKDGSVHVLDPKAVTESAARDDSDDIFSDNRLLRAPLPGMAAGVVVEQVITYRDRNPLFETGTIGRQIFGSYSPVEKTRLVLDAPASLPIRIVNKSKIEPVKTAAGGRQHIVYEAGRIEPFEDYEWNLPYDELNLPYVSFSTGTSWQEVARRYTGIVEKQIGDPAAVQAFLRNAVGKSTDRREIVSQALAAIQKNIRYAGVEVGEGSIVPRAPKDVLALKYGDCKDKATLLVAMLRASGIPANVALLSAGTDFDIEAELPGLSRFNHVIVRVGGDDPFWVDPTDEFSPAGALPVVDQDRLVLIADAATTELTRTPANESAANFTRELRTFLLAEEGKAAVTEITEAAGSYAASIRRYAAETEKKEYREAMEAYAKEAYDAETLKDVAVTDARDLTTPFRITLHIEQAGRGRTGDADAVAAIFPSALLDSLPWSLRSEPEEDEKKPKKARAHDFVLPVPYVKELQYRIVPPPGYVARTLPASETRPLGTASLTTKYEVAPDGVVLATLRFDSGKRRLTPAEMETTRKALTAVQQSNAVVVGFDSMGWSKLNAGDIGGAIAEFRRLAALHPKEARHSVQVGRAYFVGGMAEASRAELRRAIALDPAYAPAHRFLGIALQHDLLGRELRKGFDLPGAIAEYRKAKELAPKDVDTRAELAKLLSRGDEGDPFGTGAHLAEAIDEYKAIATDLKEDGYEGELLTALAHAGRFEEMKTRAREVKDEKQRLTALVIAAAATEGVDAALREAASVDTNVRRSVLGAAFPTLLHLRLYPQAAAILDHASQGAPNAAQVRPLLDVLKRTKRAEELQLGDDPKSLVMRVMLAGANAEDDSVTRTYFAPWLWDFADRVKALTHEDTATTPTSVLRARLKAQSQGLPLRVAADIGAAAMELTQEGSDGTGYRVRMRARLAGPGAAPMPSETFFVVRQQGKYVISASDSGSIGVTVVHFADKGDLDSARTWLNWAREEISAAGGDDPLASPVFAELWSKGKATATAEEIRAAAAVLIASSREFAPAAAPYLLSARETVPEALRVRVDLALAAVYGRLNEFEKAVAVTRRIVAAAPDSATAFMIHTNALLASGEVAEVQRLAQARLEKTANDVQALRMLSQSAAQAGDFETANTYSRRIIETSDASAGDYNNMAWYSLFIGKALDAAIEDANHAVSFGEDASSMHTLAALYAEVGNSLEARTKLLESLDVAGREEPSSADWYVLGRIAENYGAPEAALAAYRKVEVPKQKDFSSTYELAQRRVKSLAKK